MTNLTRDRIDRYAVALWIGDQQRQPLASYINEAERILQALPLFDRTDVIILEEDENEQAGKEAYSGFDLK